MGNTLTLIDKTAATRAGCAADTSALIAGLSLVANAGTGVAIACRNLKALTPEELITFGAPDRRLSGFDPEQEYKFAELGRNHTEVFRRLDTATRDLQTKGVLPRPIEALKAAIARGQDNQKERENRPTSQLGFPPKSTEGDCPALLPC